MPSRLYKAILVVSQALSAPYAPPERAEAAAVERAVFLPKVAYGLASASEEATCEGAWADLECRSRWPGDAASLAAFTLMEGYFESKLDPAIQRGDCPVWGPSPNQIGCDGILFKSGFPPPNIIGWQKNTKWGRVVFTSNSIFQVKVGSNDRVRDIVGDGEMTLFEASREAVKIACGARANCRRSPSWPECTATIYAGTMSFRQAPIRGAQYRKIDRAIRVELARD